ncbi:hypothetical protein AB4059_03705 [Lysobacter sp. 2RAF19]
MKGLTPSLEVAFCVVGVFVLASIVLRNRVISWLHRTGQYEEAGRPPRFFYSGILPTRLFWDSWRLERADRRLIRAYFATEIAGLVGMLVVWLVWFFSR